MNTRTLVVAALLGAGAVRPLSAQVTGTVDPADEGYRDVERLVAEGLVDRVVVGRRPYSRRRFAHIAAEARANLSRIREHLDGAAADPGRRTALERRIAVAERALGRIDAVVAAEASPRGGGVPGALTAAARIAEMRAEWTFLDSPPRTIPPAGLGALDATTNPLVDEAQGRRYANGANLAVETSHSARFGRHLALTAEPRLWMALPRGGERRVAVVPQRLAIASGARNVRLDVGREYLVLGQGMYGGLAASQNAPALAMARLSSDLPFRLPWLLGRLGLADATLFVADLGRKQNFPHARLVGYKLSVLPTQWLEVGTTVMVHTGGRGGPPATFGERMVDLVPLLDVIFLGDRDLQFSNKFSGVDLRLRVPRARGLELFAEGLLDDFDARRLRSSLWEDNGVQLGARLPSLGADGRWQLAAEYHHTGIRFYEHGQFTSGITYHRTLIGDVLGPRAEAVLARLRRDGSMGAIELTVARERRSNDQYDTRTTGANDAGFTFVKVEDRPEETRTRALLVWGRELPALGGGGRVETTAGYERVRHFAFDAGGGRNNLLARVTFVARP